MYLQILISQVSLALDILFEFLFDFLSALWILSKRVQCHRNEMRCCIDASEIKGDQLVSNLLFCYASILVRFSLFLSLGYFSIDFFHLSDIILNEVSLSMIRLVQSFLNNL